MAKLHFKYGAMNSGKSDTLIKTNFNYLEQGLETAVIKPAQDTKSDTHVTARGGHSVEADVIAFEATDVRRAVHDLAKRSLACVMVDESQFLTVKQIGQLFEIAKLDDISVIAFGLRADFRSQLFPGSKRLFEIADNIEKLPTMCGCGSQAEFNTRKVNGLYVFEGSQVAIDGDGDVTYNSLCGNCYVKEGGSV